MLLLWRSANLNQKSKDGEFWKDEYFASWDRYIANLDVIRNAKIYSPQSVALLLALCYFEALGKLLLFSENSGNHPGEKKIFIKTMQKFDISKVDAEKIYIHFRCDAVHSGPSSRSADIKNKDNVKETIDLEWFILKLRPLLEMVLVSYKNKSFDELVNALSWKRDRSEK
jgi:hypothetical protein